jgi:hypothetical protein
MEYYVKDGMKVFMDLIRASKNVTLTGCIARPLGCWLLLSLEFEDEIGLGKVERTGSMFSYQVDCVLRRTPIIN